MYIHAYIMGLSIDDALWMSPMELSCVMNGYREQEKQKYILAAQTAIMIGAVNNSYRARKPIVKVSRLIRLDSSGGGVLPGIKTLEQYNATLEKLRKITGR